MLGKNGLNILYAIVFLDFCWHLKLVLKFFLVFENY